MSAAPLAEQCAHVARAAYDGLIAEAHLTPKPGLVDRAGPGAHTDMDITTFEASADAIRPWLTRFVETGARHAPEPDPELLPELRALGRACEADMLHATGGVNTHRGAIYALGLLCGVAGLDLARDQETRCPTRRIDAWCRRASLLVGPHVVHELTDPTAAPSSGRRAHALYGMTGARGEAASGYATVRHHALPAYRARRALGAHPTEAWKWALVAILAAADDTVLADDGGPPALVRVHLHARRLMRERPRGHRLDAALEAWDRDLSARGWSPGGCADLLAVAWFLEHATGALPGRPSMMAQTA